MKSPNGYVIDPSLLFLLEDVKKIEIADVEKFEHFASEIESFMLWVRYRKLTALQKVNLYMLVCQGVALNLNIDQEDSDFEAENE